MSIETTWARLRQGSGPFLATIATGFVVRALSINCGKPPRQFGSSDLLGWWLFWSAFFGIVIGVIIGYARSGLRARDGQKKQAEGDKNGGLTWTWQKVLLVWAAIGAGVLFGGGVAARGYLVVRSQMAGETLFDSCGFWLPLTLFSLGGGLTIGLLLLTWWLVARLGFNWALGFVVLGFVLFAVFVWPTPYRYAYIRTEQIRPGGRTDTTRVVVRINRLTGHAEPIYPEDSSETKDPSK